MDRTQVHSFYLGVILLPYQVTPTKSQQSSLEHKMVSDLNEPFQRSFFDAGQFLKTLAEMAMNTTLQMEERILTALDLVSD